MHCYACAALVPLASGERVGFRDVCPACQADLHVCRQCRHGDPGAARGCRESQAEPVPDAERANHCDWFQPGGSASAGADDRNRAEARAALEALFDKGD